MRYELTQYGPTTQIVGEFNAYDDKEAVKTARSLHERGVTLSLYRIKSNAKRELIFQHDYK